jgi:PAS domain-containing protein
MLTSSCRGPELTLLYNEAYPEIVPDRIPGLMGNGVRQAFAGAWETWEPFYSRCAEVGHGATFDDMQLFLDRGFGPQEECYVSFSLAPVVDDEGNMLGWFQHVTETTRRKIGERRMATILQIGERTATAQNLASFWQELAVGLEADVYDTSFALLYSVSEDSSQFSDTDSTSTDSKGVCTKILHLEGSVGVPDGHPGAPSLVEGSNLMGITEYFKEAHKTGEPLLLQVEDGTLAEDLVEGLRSREFLDPCTSVVIIEIVPTTGHDTKRDTVLGYVVLGLNTRRPFDSEYFLFIQVLRRQLTTSMAAVLLLEEEVRRGRTIAEQAAIDQQIMAEKLYNRTSELEERSLQLKHFADCVPVGIFVLEFSPENPGGSYVYRNEKWFELVGAKVDPAGTPMESPIWRLIHNDDFEEVRMNWMALLESKEATTKSYSFRVPKRNDIPVEDDPNPTWILTYAFSIIDENGNLKSVIGSLTDITAQKRAEDMQKQRTEDALESKRQQENFIDVTSV